MNQAKIENEKRILLSDLINFTKQVASKFNGSKKIVTEDEVEVANLIKCWEKLISFGLKTSILTNLRVANLTNVQEIFNSSGSQFWSFAHQFLSHDDQMRFNNFKNLWTDRARTKALIRNGMNEGCLERYLLTWISAENLNEYYEAHSLMRDEKNEILPKLAADISNILFAIAIDIPELNVSSHTPAVAMVEPVIESTSKVVKSSISKPKKLNQIDNFEESKKDEMKKEAIPVLVSKVSEDLGAETISSDRISISTESSSMSQSNFFDAKDEENAAMNSDTISHSSTSSSEDEGANSELPEEPTANEAKNDSKVQVEYDAIMHKQRDRITELEQQVLDLTLENSRLRQLLNANKVNTSANFQVSIPRAILRKSKTKTNYYVYEINLKTTNGSENWTIFKRYRDFYKLHKELKKQHIQIKVLDFPPKKKIGNMDFEFVESRRQRLQVYIRHVLQNLPELQVETRQLLEAKCLFFKP